MKLQQQPGRILIIKLFALALLVLSGAVARAQETKKPLGKQEVIKAISINEPSTVELVKQIEARGVAFRMSADDETELKTAGASSALIEAVRRNYRAPLDRAELEAMLRLARKNRAGTGEILGEIKKRGVSFELNAESKDALRKAGANASLIAAARDNYRPDAPVNPSLPVAATIPVDPAILPIDQIPYGNPKSTTGSSSGRGTGSGVGTGEGVGPGSGDADHDEGGGGPGKTGPVDYTRVFSQRDVTTRAVITRRPDPVYTEEARQNQVSGTVLLRMVLRANGEVTNISVVRGLPNGLSERAIDAARQIKFKPAQKDGHVVSQYVLIEYSFSIY
jgi:TonB family protein